MGLTAGAERDGGPVAAATALAASACAAVFIWSTVTLVKLWLLLEAANISAIFDVAAVDAAAMDLNNCSFWLILLLLLLLGYG